MAKDKNPKFVRLSPKAARGMQADVKGSGWSISGNDVKPFPERSSEKQYVRGLINKGLLVPCSRAEFEEAHDGDAEEAPDADVGHQEHRVYEKAAARSAKAKAEREASLLAAEVESEEDAESESEGTDEDGDGNSEEDLVKVVTENAEAKAEAAAPAAKKAAGKAKKAPAKKGARAKNK